jgi:putative membrane fusion protein
MKGKNKRKKTKIISFIAIIFLLLYIPSFVHFIYGKNIITDLLRIGTIEDFINTDAYIIRDETTLAAPFSGKFIAEVSEGDKIPSNCRVATVLKDESAKLIKDMNEINLKIIEAQKQLNKNQEFFSEDMQKIDNEIAKKVKNIVDATNKNNLSDIGDMKKKIDELVEKKAVIAGGTGATNVYITSMKNEKEILQQKINRNTVNIISEKSGIVSFCIDGYEETLNSNAVMKLTPKVLEGIKNKRAAGNTADKSVEAGKSFVKVIKGNECIITAIMDPQKAEQFKEGDVIEKIRINDIDKVVKGTVWYISDEIDSKIIVSFKVYSGISETAGLRKINVDIIRKSYEGLKVPIKSLTDIDWNNNTASIALVKANYITFRPVKIISKNDEYVVITGVDKSDKSVSLYDTYVIHPVNIEEGQMINQ